MLGTRMLGVDGGEIYNIKQKTATLDLRREVVKGLLSHPPKLPSLLIWDDNGAQLFDRYSQTPTYYPFHSEIEVLDRYAPDIAANAPSGGAVIELGCGAVRKTKSILSQFHQQQKPIHYYALDVSLPALVESVSNLTEAMGDSEYVTITGLLGTYDDCILWLGNANNLRDLSSITFLWMGNSITNFDHYSDASALTSKLANACKKSRLPYQFLVSVDICKEETKVLKAYDLQLPEFDDFVSNGLVHVNSTFGYNMFNLEDWLRETDLNQEEHTLQIYYRARRDVYVTLEEGTTIFFRKGEKLNLVSSGKWTDEVMEELSAEAGMHVQQKWKDQHGDYCIYSLRPDDFR